VLPAPVAEPLARIFVQDALTLGGEEV
jgi:hypothetical protein